MKTETVRGRLADERADQLVRFWSEEAGVEEAEGRRHLPEVVCVLLGGEGELAGAASVYPASVPLIAGRRFWIYRSVLASDAKDAQPALIGATFAALEEEFDPSGNGPIGLCVPVEDRDEMKRRPEAEWTNPRFVFAGYHADGSQIRIGYFAGAKIGLTPEENQRGGVLDPGKPYSLDEGYRVGRFDEQDIAGEQDVIDLWTRETPLDPGEIQRRVSEVHMAATDSSGELVGVTTAYLQRNDQLGAEFWHYRGLVAAAHQTSNIGLAMGLGGRDDLERRYVAGEDTRAPGIIFEVENENMRRYFLDAIWLRFDFVFIGENERGFPVRVHYFPGAMAPDPPR